MKGRKLEISAAEMLEMRNDGMTNRDVAAALEISYPSVCRRIGRAPADMRGTMCAWAKPKRQDPVPAVPPVVAAKPKPAIAMKDEVIFTGWTSERGTMFTAEIDNVHRKITAAIGGSEDNMIEIDVGDAMDLASFVVAAAMRIGGSNG